MERMGKFAGTRNSWVTPFYYFTHDSATNILENRPGFIDIRAKRRAFQEKKEGKLEAKTVM